MKKLLLSFLLCSFSLVVMAQEPYAIEQLENSPRHHEWVEIEYGDRIVHTFVAYPEVSEPAPVIIAIHENRGLTDWVRSFADQAAAAGYITLTPDLLSGFDDEHERTSDFENSDAARDALYQLDPDQVTMDLEAVKEYAAEIAAGNGQIVVAGFCWGGSQSFRFATNTEGLAAAMVFYGSPPEQADAYRAISTPVYGFYGGDDQRINATIDETARMMESFDKSYEYVIYEGAGHAYMRSGDDPNGSRANKEARDQSWERLRTIMSELE